MSCAYRVYISTLMVERCAGGISGMYLRISCTRIVCVYLVCVSRHIMAVYHEAETVVIHEDTHLIQRDIKRQMYDEAEEIYRCVSHFL